MDPEQSGRQWVLMSPGHDAFSDSGTLLDSSTPLVCGWHVRKEERTIPLRSSQSNQENKMLPILVQHNKCHSTKGRALRDDTPVGSVMRKKNLSAREVRRKECSGRKHVMS
jgi:hypothetical protein